VALNTVSYMCCSLRFLICSAQHDFYMWRSTQFLACGPQHKFLHVLLNTISYMWCSTQFLTCGAQHSFLHLSFNTISYMWRSTQFLQVPLHKLRSELESLGWSPPEIGNHRRSPYISRLAELAAGVLDFCTFVCNAGRSSQPRWKQ